MLVTALQHRARRQAAQGREEARSKRIARVRRNEGVFAIRRRDALLDQLLYVLRAGDWFEQERRLKTIGHRHERALVERVPGLLETGDERLGTRGRVAQRDQ